MKSGVGDFNGFRRMLYSIETAEKSIEMNTACSRLVRWVRAMAADNQGFCMFD